MLYRKWTQWSKHANSSPSGISLGLQQLLGKEAHSISLFVRAKYCVKCQRCKLHCLPVFPPIIVSTWSTPSQLRTSVFSKTIFWDTQTRTRSLELILQRCQTLSVTCDRFRTGTHCIHAHVGSSNEHSLALPLYWQTAVINTPIISHIVVRHIDASTNL